MTQKKKDEEHITVEWYYYLLVMGVLALFLLGAYQLMFYLGAEDAQVQKEKLGLLYNKYSYELDGFNHTVLLRFTKEDLEQNNSIPHDAKQKLLEHNNVAIALPNMTVAGRGNLSIGSLQIAELMQRVFRTKVTIVNQTDCSNSSLTTIALLPDFSKTKSATWDENCLLLEGSPHDLLHLANEVMFRLVEE